MNLILLLFLSLTFGATSIMHAADGDMSTSMIIIDTLSDAKETTAAGDGEDSNQDDDNSWITVKKDDADDTASASAEKTHADQATSAHTSPIPAGSGLAQDQISDLTVSAVFSPPQSDIHVPHTPTTSPGASPALSFSSSSSSASSASPQSSPSSLAPMPSPAFSSASSTTLALSALSVTIPPTSNDLDSDAQASDRDVTRAPHASHALTALAALTAGSPTPPTTSDAAITASPTPSLLLTASPPSPLARPGNPTLTPPLTAESDDRAQATRAEVASQGAHSNSRQSSANSLDELLSVEDAEDEGEPGAPSHITRAALESAINNRIVGRRKSTPTATVANYSTSSSSDPSSSSNASPASLFARALATARMHTPLTSESHSTSSSSDSSAAAQPPVTAHAERTDDIEGVRGLPVTPPRSPYRRHLSPSPRRNENQGSTDYEGTDSSSPVTTAPSAPAPSSPPDQLEPTGCCYACLKALCGKN